MLDYKELYYESQARFADTEEDLRKLTLKLQQIMRDFEERVINDDNSENE